MGDDARAKRSKAPVGPAPPALLKIAPAVLYYAPPYNRVIMNSITLQNLTPNFVAYKVKTTAPKRYCVRPNTGVIAPQCIIEVQVHLTAFNEAEIQKEKDRFQIQSVDLSSSELPAESKDVWRTVSDTQIIKQRIKVKFANPPTSKSSSTSTSTSSSPPSSSEVAPPVRHVQNKPDIDSSFTTSTPSTEAKQRTIQESLKPSSPAQVEELQDKLRKITAEKDKLAKDLEALLSQNRRLLAAQESRTGGFIDLKLIVLALIFLLLGYYFGSPGASTPVVTLKPSTTPAIE